MTSNHDINNDVKIDNGSQFNEPWRNESRYSSMTPVLAIHDIKNGVFFCNSVQVVEEVENARRQFIIACRSKDSIFYHFKEDFELVQVGAFDSLTGIFEHCNTRVIQRGADVQ